ncbi:MAG: GntR family transcriptional regulator [Armatimonadota bacterium]|nr:GntR family transcriptional regulator [Armatimonadota bacterium]
MNKLGRLDGVSRYQQVREILRQEIIEQNMKPGERLAPERELAERFGVSRFTVCRALSALVQEGVLVRQQGNGTFVSSWRERPIRSRTQTIALSIPLRRNMRIPGEIVKGAAHAMQEKDYKLVLTDTSNSALAEAREIEKHRRERVDGFIIWPVDRDPNYELLKELLYTGPPIVLIDRFFEDIPSDFVVTDNFWGAYEATRILIERGHRRIAHFSALTSRNTALEQRRAGYEKALMDNGIDPDPELVCPPMEYPGAISFRHTMVYLRRLPDPITAVFTVNDPYAWAACRAALDAGLEVPRDIEIATFFDELGVDEGLDVPFIRVAQPTYEMGLRAAEVLLDRIEGIGGAEPIRIFLKPKVVTEDKAEQRTVISEQ